MRCVFFLIYTLLVVNPSRAQDDSPVAMDEIQCLHLIDLGEDEISFLLAWLDGYFNHMHGTARMSDQNLASLGKMIEDGCADDPERGLLDMLQERIRQDALNLHP